MRQELGAGPWEANPSDATSVADVTNANAHLVM